MFVRSTLTAWSEALKAVVHDSEEYAGDLKGLPVHTEYPTARVDYPGIWLNYSMQGDLKNVGIGHIEMSPDGDGDLHEVTRWHFGGMVEFTICAMTNLERAAMIDEFTRLIAIGRPGRNPEGEFRRVIEEHDLIGQLVTWDSYSVGAFAESQGTPWGTDDVIYEATIGLTTSGEVVVDPDTGKLVLISAVLSEVVVEGTAEMPVRGNDGWI